MIESIEKLHPHRSQMKLVSKVTEVLIAQTALEKTDLMVDCQEKKGHLSQMVLSGNLYEGC